MTIKIGSAAAAKAAQLIGGPSGVQAKLSTLTQGDSSFAVTAPAEVRQQNVAADLVEKAGGASYPAVTVYCQKIVNSQKEKFRRFSGQVHVAAEVRHSQDRLDGLESRLQIYVDAVAQTLQSSVGDWGDGMFFGGGYEVSFSAVKHGGRNFLQAAVVTFALDVSK